MKNRIENRKKVEDKELWLMSWIEMAERIAIIIGRAPFVGVFTRSTNVTDWHG